MATTLVINPGSSSKKYALYRDTTAVVEIRFEETNTGFEMCAAISGHQRTCQAIKEKDFNNSFSRVAEEVKKYLREEQIRLDAVSVRVVAPGTFFQKHQVIDTTFIRELERRQVSVPLHIPMILREIKNAQEHFSAVPLIAASDSAFHVTMPTRAREFSIDRSDASQFDMHRFGYHGLSVASVVRRIHPLTGINPKQLIVCHIGGGVSVTAVKDGQSIDTTMGYAPTSGLPMGSRAGELDAGAILALMRLKNLKPSEMEMYIHTKGGLAGLSGESDIRRLLDRRARGDLLATETLSHFVYHIQKAIAALTVPLGGLDMIALTGTASVRSDELRSLIFSGLQPIGLQIDNDRNLAVVGGDGVVSANRSAVKVVVVRTDEMGEMAKVAEQINLQRVKS